MKGRGSILFIGLVLPLLSQQGQPPQAMPDDDVPGRPVARLSLVTGDVAVRRGDSGPVIAAAPNAPLLGADRVSTGPQSRAEVQLDWANFVRLGSNSEVRLSGLDNGRYQLQIAVGTTTFRVLRNTRADIEISTPAVSIHPLSRGVYRVSVHDDGSAEITVREGEAEIFSPHGSERLQPGGTMWARRGSTDAEIHLLAAIPHDDWDGWNASRDAFLERAAQVYRHVSPDIVGVEDLEGQGRWITVAGYGSVWSPNVDPSWAPYRYGRWAWVDYYGWTWISNDPWGWAPYHYGRWFDMPGYGWCWWPGPVYGRHYWRPALVAFFGWGGRGGFGWVPLAPYEPFHPWYGRGIYTGSRGGIIMNVNILATYRNARMANGFTAVSTDAFGRRSFSSTEIVRLSPRELQSAALLRGALPVTPGRESVRLSDRAYAPAARVSNTSAFFSRRKAQTAPLANSGWRRVEDPSPHRFGDPAAHPTIPLDRSYRPPQPSAMPVDRGDNRWSAFGNSGASRLGLTDGTTKYAPMPPPQPPQGAGSRSPQPVRISPPMVRERPNPPPSSNANGRTR